MRPTISHSQIGEVSPCARIPFTKAELAARGLIGEGQLPFSPRLILYARRMRKEMTKAERKLWYDYLRRHEKKFYRQRPIDHFIADFYCSDARLIIEVDGSQHYTAEGLKRDAIRTEILSLYGLRIIRFTNSTILNNFQGACQAIETKLHEF